MTGFDEVVQAYRTGAEPDRCWLIEQLGDIEDPRVVPFLLEVLGNPGADSNERVVILEDLKLRRFSRKAEKREVAQEVLRVYESENDDVVRSYALMCLRNFAEVPEVLSTLRRVVLDSDGDETERFNALAAIEANSERPDCRAVLEEVKRLPDIGRYVTG